MLMAYSMPTMRLASAVVHNYRTVKTLTYRYDDNATLQTLSYQDHRLVHLEYDAMGREVARRFGNQLTTQQNYDPQGRLLAQLTTNAHQQNMSQRHYSYDAQGRIASHRRCITR